MENNLFDNTTPIQSRILLVDDDQDILSTYTRILEKGGHQVQTACDRKHAMEVLESDIPDLILLDVNLGKDSGFDLMKEIQQNEKLKYVYIVLISGKYTTPRDQTYGLNIGADGYITRPMDQEELLARIHVFARHKKTLDQLRKSESRFRKIILKNPDAILIISEKGKIVFANPAAEKMLDSGENEILERDFGFPAPTTQKAEIELLSGLGQSTFGEMHTIEIEWDNLTAFLTSIRDISKRVQAEEKLKKSMEEKSMLSSRLITIREDERKKLAGNIHDDLGQLLTALKMDLQWIERHIDKTNNTLGKRVASALSVIDHSIRSVQQITLELRPPILDHLGLMKALESFASEFENRTEIKVHVNLPGEELVQERKLAIALYRIIQEAFTNVARHAQANHIWIHCRRKQSNLLMEVTDDGIGIDKDKLSSSDSLGIIGMRERITHLKGTLDIHKNKDKGTIVRILVPLNQQKD